MKKIIYTTLAFILTFNSYSQIAKGDKEYEKFAYVDAIKTYERLFEKGYKSQDMLEKLANSYYFKADLGTAVLYYRELFALKVDLEPEYYYRFSQCLKSIEDYKKADEIMLKFNQKNDNDLRAKLASLEKNYLDEIEKNSGRYIIENAGINSRYSDYGSAFYNNKLIFTSARDTGVIGGSRKHSWNGESFTNLYNADIDDQGNVFSPKKFGSELKSKFHESTPVFTKDGKTVYFTRNNYLNGKRGKDSDKTTLLKVYKATLNGDKWENIIELAFNSNDYSVAHPSLSADEKTLYFASNMPGTIGQSDLFKVSINADGSFGEPINLGNTVNTEGRETFPMITSSNELYFASDGHPGLGGLDIFVAQQQEDGSYKNIQNIGKPLNSSKDDFGFLINEKSRFGYVSSNRDGGEGSDDIYKFIEIKKLECEQFLLGIVVDKITGLPLANTKVTLSGENYDKLRELVTDNQGKFDFGKVDCGSKYYIKSEKQEYAIVEISTVTKEESGKTEVKIELEKEVKAVKLGDDLRFAFGIEVIYFDLDKSKIRSDAAIELAKILDVLEQNPTMEISIGSHTDCRQTAKYNLKLSERRARATMLWLVEKGIKKSRLTAKGYGETQLVNNCGCEPTNESNCTEQQHQANRRSEFLVTKL
ncbi:OmpA family protein [Flavobacterium sp. 245]|uniref:OmpA family protein n=1 Tax=Flavobacterium sp. 245 TaxID=2512115 RepID=UPI00105CF26B|nr:OmpA family protein [Flavobacterium sp. 245]TDO96166.1 intein [Flavobacterium sp. 245]